MFSENTKTFEKQSPIFFEAFSANIMFVRNLGPGIGRYSFQFLLKIASLHVNLQSLVVFHDPGIMV